ncbi:MAG: type IV toxin-antitoxin system AbiEi family antitoxin domain-containing protein [Candidatus Nanopelagicales bacterium]|nr:type IV toxin-antitoxin system AbiEi family antitoxin domain-containing protein [Candidatus Nanopelagicales bacterium]MDZ4248844.1 type IV toxin-antitoxin system AbiEi family antitoxin domain-containing protein [Candidatus Nanopelagicales bacterium]
MPRTSSPSETARMIAAAFGASVFRRDQAAAVGVSLGRLRAAVDRGLVVRVARGGYAVPPAESDGLRADYLLRVAAALARRAGGVASHESAAAALGLPHPWAARWTSLSVVLTEPDGVTRLRHGVRTFRQPLDGIDLIQTPWGRATNLARTAVDLGRTLALPQAMVCADAAARFLSPDQSRDGLLRTANRECVRQQFAEALGRVKWQHVPPKAKLLAALADPAAESPAESVSRGWIIAAGLPLPGVGLAVLGASGVRYYGDLVWSDLGVIAEVDGLIKYDQPGVLIQEKLREDDLRRAGWTVVRWTGSEIRRRPMLVINRLRVALAQAASERGAGAGVADLPALVVKNAIPGREATITGRSPTAEAMRRGGGRNLARRG